MQLFITLLLSGIFIILLMNLGRLFDVTVEPKKADIIVCLGGGGPERINKTLELYKLGYSQTDKIIYTGPPAFFIHKKRQDKLDYLVSHGIPKHHIIHAKNTNSTMKEVIFVKNYMLQHHLKSVMFVSDPPHSRRIMFLANRVANYDDVDLSCSVVGSDVDWWDREHYYKDKKAIVFIAFELIKLPVNYIAYAILQKSKFLN